MKMDCAYDLLTFWDRVKTERGTVNGVSIHSPDIKGKSGQFKGVYPFESSENVYILCIFLQVNGLTKISSFLRSCLPCSKNFLSLSILLLTFNYFLTLTADSK